MQWTGMTRMQPRCADLSHASSVSQAPNAGARAQAVKVDAKAAKALREATGAGMMDAKKALAQTGNDFDRAVEYLRKKGLASADKKAGRAASEGAVGAYIHAGSRCMRTTPCAVPRPAGVGWCRLDACRPSGLSRLVASLDGLQQVHAALCCAGAWEDAVRIGCRGFLLVKGWDCLAQAGRAGGGELRDGLRRPRRQIQGARQ